MVARRGADRHDQGLVGAGGGVEEGEPLLDGERGGPRGGDALHVGLGEGAGHAAGLFPGTPGQGEPGQPLGPAVLRQRVHEHVGSGVVCLPRTAHHTRHRREHHERRQTHVPRQLVQMPRSIHLRTQHPRQPLRRQPRHHTVVQHTRRMHHSRQRMPHRHRTQQPRHRTTVRHITGHHVHLGTQPGQLLTEGVHTLRRRTTPRHQQQTPHPTHRHQMTRHLTPQTTRPTSDQHGALGVPARRHRQHDLAHMLRPTHEAERLTRPPHIPRTHRQRAQRPLREQAQEFAQHLADTLGAASPRSKAR